MAELNQITATPEEVAKLIDKIDTVVRNEPPGTLFLAALSIALILSDPQITAKQLLLGIKGVSEWIAIYMNGPRDESKIIMN